MVVGIRVNRLKPTWNFYIAQMPKNGNLAASDSSTAMEDGDRYLTYCQSWSGLYRV